jgi:cell division protein FtsB
MNFLKNKRKITARLSPRIFLGIVAVIAAFSINGAWHAYQDSRAAAERRGLEQKELAELKDREYHLTAELDALNTDRGVEAAIREKFGLVKDGEEIVVLPAGKDKDSNGRDEASLWAKIKGWFTRD